MLKNRFFSIFAVTALVGLAACGGEEEGAIEETNIDATVPAAEPAAPVVVDPATAPVVVDPAAPVVTDPAAGTTAPVAGDTMAVTPQP